MPYISAKTSVKIDADKEKELKEKLGKAIETFPGKTERWLMLSIEDGIKMYFQGTADRPCAMVEIKIFGKSDKTYYSRMTETVCSIFDDVLSIPSDRVYVQYEECDKWGWNGSNF